MSNDSRVGSWPWIISPWADSLFIVGTPLAIVPCLAWLNHHILTPEQLSLWVFAFASLGHHLPGLIRAYGDRELFRRFRYRFIAGPIIATFVSWLCFLHWKIHTLELVLLFWATWHIMMQTYGFMRIYDAKLGRVSPSDARIDFAACFCLFSQGIIGSDARVFGIAESMSLCGLPLPSSNTLELLRTGTLLITACVVVVFVAYNLRPASKSRFANWLKIVLLITTGSLYWYTGQLPVNVLLGVAMFEVFHAVQYCAIVWGFQRSRHDRTPKASRNLWSIFGNHWWGLPVYIAVIVAFGAVGFWGRSGMSASVTPWALTLFSASAMLHFYYDGFIWKLRDRQVSDAIHAPARTTNTPSRPLRRISLSGHAAKWSMALALLLGAGYFEHAKTASQPDSASDNDRWRSLAQLTPTLGEVQLRDSQRAVVKGDYPLALDAASSAVTQRPRSFAAHFALGRANECLKNWSAAETSYATALTLRPNDTDTQFRLGLSAVQTGHFEVAIGVLTECLDHQPDNLQANFQLGNAFFSTNAATKAAASYRKCIQLDEQFVDAHNNLGAALFQANDLQAAISAYQSALKLDPQNANSHYNLGLAYLILGDRYQARESILRSIDLGGQPTPEVSASLGL